MLNNRSRFVKKGEYFDKNWNQQVEYGTMEESNFSFMYFSSRLVLHFRLSSVSPSSTAKSRYYPALTNQGG